MDRRARLDEICRRRGLLAVYLFGSRASDGRSLLRDDDLTDRSGSDLDVGVFFLRGRLVLGELGPLHAELAEVFEPLRVDLVPLDQVDALFQFNAIEGFRIAAPDSTLADENELLVMRRAADLLPFQRQIEIDRFGVATS